MRFVRFLFLLLMFGCASSKVLVDYDDKTDFSAIKTFDFYEDNGENLNELDVKRMTTAIKNSLENYGLNQSYEPDVFVFFEATISEHNNNNTIGIGVGTGGRNGGIGISGGIPIGGKKLNEEIVIKFIAAQTNNLIWEGTLSATTKEKRTPEERTTYLTTIVQKILSEFPQKKNQSFKIIKK